MLRKTLMGELAGAIIAQAIKDYYEVLSAADCKSARKEKRELEQFFVSDWFDSLAYLSGSELNGERLMNMLKAKAKEEIA